MYTCVAISVYTHVNVFTCVGMDMCIYNICVCVLKHDCVCSYVVCAHVYVSMCM